MQLTYHTDYALRLLIYLLSHPDRTVSTREMAEFYGVSLNHLVKVAKSLTRGGWLISSRGVGGGVMLAKHTPDTKVGDIVRYTENTDIVECFQPKTNTCPIHRNCDLKPILFQARRAFFDVLDSFTVRDLARHPNELLALTRAVKHGKPKSRRST
ncbi:Rrf2 family transcriptional regulator [Verrucomicrobium sp. BvORR106]|uniref:RrF2 family transcriptional regulator n=1 Tax=Verrucomicrobium sp. BvORR106 TaxID=1403819 RepID=UPI000570CCD9|nr:Rrf2 family transcriptional regulator [Verrucomicrobium sp. BvORR106]